MVSNGKRSSAAEMRREAKALSAESFPVLKHGKVIRSEHTLEGKTEIASCLILRSHNFLRTN